MKRLLFIVQLAAAGSLIFVATGCETDDPANGPTDSTSSLPWNRPQPGERTSPLAPFQSH